MGRLTVPVTDAIGRARPSGGLGRWLAGAAPARAAGVVIIALVDDRTMRRLNRRFRRVDRVTDVLSFPSAPQPVLRRRLEGCIPKPLGDIAIALGRAQRQARDHGHSLQTELRVLALHGLLHLLGYDHETDQGQMQRVEERLRRRAGLPSGLIGRRSARRSSERATASEPARTERGSGVPASERVGGPAGAKPPGK